MLEQCKIELNPQIHGLTRCIQQNGPSVRLILTDQSLDRMFWKGKGAFILGCTSPLKAIVGNCQPIFGAFSILLHVHCVPFLSFSTIYVLLQLVTLLASMHIAIFRYFVFLMLLPVHSFFLHSSFLVPLWFRSINASITSVEARLATNICG
jgi:hypothetical protein